jgi:hypothetical protein
MNSSEPSVEFRKLIDERLDEIDRALVLAEISWSERRSIVGEVETQVFELLARRGESPTKDELVEVLNSLDPPESFLPEGASTPVATPSARSNWVEQTVKHAARFSTVAVQIVSLFVVNGVVLVIVVASDGVLPWLVTLACLGWLNYEGVRRFRNWSAMHQGNLINGVRDALAGWLMTQDRVPVS